MREEQAFPFKYPIRHARGYAQYRIETLRDLVV